MKHSIIHTFESTLLLSEWDKLPRYQAFWQIYDCIKKEKVKYIKVVGYDDLELMYQLDEGRYTVHNGIDKYSLVVSPNGSFKVYNNTGKSYEPHSYMFV